jgi:hypothetical protein
LHPSLTADMLFSKLKKYFLNRVNLYASEAKDKLQVIDQKIGILALITAPDQMDQVLRFVSVKQHEGKQVDFLFYSEDKSLVHEKLFTQKSIKWNGKIESEIVSDFLANDFDILYVPTSSEPMEMQYILKKTKCKIRVGIYQRLKENYLDLYLDTPETNLNSIIQELDNLRNNLKNIKD